MEAWKGLTAPFSGGGEEERAAPIRVAAGEGDRIFIGSYEWDFRVLHLPLWWSKAG